MGISLRLQDDGARSSARPLSQCAGLVAETRSIRQGSQPSCTARKQKGRRTRSSSAPRVNANSCGLSPSLGEIRLACEDFTPVFSPCQVAGARWFTVRSLLELPAVHRAGRLVNPLAVHLSHARIAAHHRQVAMPKQRLQREHVAALRFITRFRKPASIPACLASQA